MPLYRLSVGPAFRTLAAGGQARRRSAGERDRQLPRPRADPERRPHTTLSGRGPVETTVITPLARRALPATSGDGLVKCVDDQGQQRHSCTGRAAAEAPSADACSRLSDPIPIEPRLAHPRTPPGLRAPARTPVTRAVARRGAPIAARRSTPQSAPESGNSSTQAPSGPRYQLTRCVTGIEVLINDNFTKQLATKRVADLLTITRNRRRCAGGSENRNGALGEQRPGRMTRRGHIATAIDPAAIGQATRSHGHRTRVCPSSSARPCRWRPRADQRACSPHFLVVARHTAALPKLPNQTGIPGFHHRTCGSGSSQKTGIPVLVRVSGGAAAAAALLPGSAGSKRADLLWGAIARSC